MSKEEVQLALHEERINKIGEDVAKIKDNHLPHLQTGINELNVKIIEKTDEIRIKLARLIGIAVGVLGLLNLILIALQIFHK